MKKSIGAAALCCGLVFAAGADAPQPAVLPDAGPMSTTTMQRLLLIDAEHFGHRIVAVGDRGYIVVSDDYGKTWSRAKARRRRCSRPSISSTTSWASRWATTR